VVNGQLVYHVVAEPVPAGWTWNWVTGSASQLRAWLAANPTAARVLRNRALGKSGRLLRQRGIS